jgi:hypothetical protein
MKKKRGSYRMYSVRFQKAEESVVFHKTCQGIRLNDETAGNGQPVFRQFNQVHSFCLTRFMEDNGLQADQEQMERAIMNGTFSKELREELTASNGQPVFRQFNQVHSFCSCRAARFFRFLKSH